MRIRQEVVRHDAVLPRRRRRDLPAGARLARVHDAGRRRVPLPRGDASGNRIFDARAMSPASPASSARVVSGLAGSEPGRGSVASPGLVRVSGTRRRGRERSPAFAVEANVLSGASRVVLVIPRVGVGESLHPRARCQPATGANQRGAGTGPVQHAMRGSSYGGLERRGFDFGQEVYCLQPTETCCLLPNLS